MDENSMDGAAQAASEQAAAAGEGASEALVETSHLLGILIGKLQGWFESAVAMLPNFVAALVIVGLFALASGIVAKVVRRAGERSRFQDELVHLLASTVRIGVLAVGLFVALGVLQLEKTVTSLLAGVGVIGLALGFAFQDIAANFMAGIILAMRTPFHEGDLVETHDVMGQVQDVTLRATVVRTFQGQNVIIPNKDVLQNPITNYSETGERRVDLDCGVSYDDDLEEAKRVAIEAVEGVPERDTERDVDLSYSEFGDSSINFTIRFWLTEPGDFLAGRSNAIIAVKKAFDEHGINIPFPIRTLDLPSSDEDQDAREAGSAGAGNGSAGRGSRDFADAGPEGRGDDAGGE